MVPEVIRSWRVPNPVGTGEFEPTSIATGGYPFAWYVRICPVGLAFLFICDTFINFNNIGLQRKMSLNKKVQRELRGIRL